MRWRNRAEPEESLEELLRVDQLFLEATGEIFQLRKQVDRLKSVMEKDRREFCEDRRKWQAEEAVLVECNHNLAAQLAAADAQLIAWGAESND